MTIEQAFELVANLDYKESHRRYAPQHGLLQFDRRGAVMGVYRFKKKPSETEQYETLEKHPGCLQFFTSPDSFANSAELKKRIDAGLWLFANVKP